MTKLRVSFTPLCWGICLIFGLAACSGTSSQPLPFRAPTAAVSKPIALATGTNLSPAPERSSLVTPTPACTDALTFVVDLSLPDGSDVKPGEVLDKRWMVKNSGTCNWDKTYHLKLASGPAMGVSETQALFPARGGSQAPIRLLFTAPLEPGRYRSAWQAYNSQDEPFGDPFFIEIVVSQP